MSHMGCDVERNGSQWATWVGDVIKRNKIITKEIKKIKNETSGIKKRGRKFLWTNSVNGNS